MTVDKALEDCAQYPADTTTLASINRCRHQAENAVRLRFPNDFDAQAWNRFWDAIDERFGSRPDYRLWRWSLSLKDQHRLPRPSSLGHVKALCALVQEGLEHPSPLVRWGTVGCFAMHLYSEAQVERAMVAQGVDETGADWTGFITDLYQRIVDKREFPSLASSPFQCACIRMGAIAVFQKILFEARVPSVASRQFQRRHFKAISQALTAVQTDPWSTIESPEQVLTKVEPTRILPLGPVRLAYPVHNALYRASMMRPTHKEWGAVGERELGKHLDEAYRFAFLAWLGWRSVRIAEERRRAEGKARAAQPLRLAQTGEIHAIRSLAFCALVSGKPMRNAKASFLELVRMHHWSEHQRTDADKLEARRQQLGFNLRRLGLEVPRAPAQEGAEEAPGLAGGDAQVAAPRAGGAAEPVNWLVRRAYERAPGYEHIRALAPDLDWDSSPSHALGKLVLDLEGSNGPALSEGVLDALSDVLHWCGELGTAIQLIESWPSAERLAAVCEQVRSIQRFAPFALDVPKHLRWQKSMMAALARLPGRDAIELAVHGAVLGRGLSVIQHFPVASRELSESWFGGGAGSRRIEDSMRLRDDGDESDRLWPDHLPHASTVSHVSVVHSDVLGMSVLARSGELLRSKRISPQERERILGDVSAARADIGSWAIDGGISVGDALAAFCRLLDGLARAVAPQLGWIALSLPGDLCSLPWQMIFRHLRLGAIVALVPAYEWWDETEAKMWKRPEPELHLDEADACLEPLRQSARQARALRERPRHSVVIGHGRWAPGDDLPEVIAPRPLSHDDWHGIANSGVAVLHVCWAAGNDGLGRGLNDFGHLPALLLGYGAKLVCAPVVDVGIDVAQVLQETLTEAMGRSPQVEFGAVYLAALRRDERVGFYSLFGLPTEKV